MPSGGITIVDASPADLDDLLTMNESLHAAHTQGAPDVFRPFDRAGVGNWFSQGIANERCKIIIAKNGPDSVGYAYATIQDRKENVFCKARRFVEIDHVYVGENHRKGGVCTMLFDVVFTFAKANAIADVELTTWCFNESAQAAFARAGFTQRFTRFLRTMGNE